MQTWHWIALTGGGLLALEGLTLGVSLLRSRGRAQKGLILALLTERGPMTGMQLKQAGVASGLIYNRLKELETDGLIASKPLEEDLLPGQLQRRLYWVKGAPPCST